MSSLPPHLIFLPFTALASDFSRALFRIVITETAQKNLNLRHWAQRGVLHQTGHVDHEPSKNQEEGSHS